MSPASSTSTRPSSSSPASPRTRYPTGLGHGTTRRVPFRRSRPLQEFGVDTHAVRASMIGFMEGPSSTGYFTVTFMAATCTSAQAYRPARLRHHRPDERSRRLAFVRLLIGGMMNNPVDQLGAMRDLALPDDTDLEAVAQDLGLLDDIVDPTTMTPDQLTEELQRS